jgi:hypothetical protein
MSDLTFHCDRFESLKLQVIHDDINFRVEIFRRSKGGLRHSHLVSITSHLLPFLQLGNNPVNLFFFTITTSSALITPLPSGPGQALESPHRNRKSSKWSLSGLCLRPAFLLKATTTADLPVELRLVLSEDELCISTTNVLAATCHIMVLVMRKAGNVRLVRIFGHVFFL